MFHIHTFDGIQFNVPLESLKKKKEISRLERSYHTRKVIDKKESEEGSDSYNGRNSYAVKAYREAVSIKDEREPVLHAYSIMKSPVLTLDPEMKIIDAWNLFKKKGVSHMPVFANNKILGIVSDRDILRYLIIVDNKIENNSDKTVREIMTDHVITAGRLTDIRRIAKAMFENHIGTMPIVEDDGALTGIITRSDILYALINYPPLNLWV
ncbi:MAG TPA: CBS domain-containing protein [Spirochaetota bacterium]|nr:CBS domain-containing protein [Spirochaetota bacterium]